MGTSESQTVRSSAGFSSGRGVDSKSTRPLQVLNQNFISTPKKHGGYACFVSSAGDTNEYMLCMGGTRSNLTPNPERLKAALRSWSLNGDGAKRAKPVIVRSLL